MVETKNKMDSSVQDDVSSFITYAVIEFDSKCSDEIKQWLKSKLEAPKTSYGAGLITKFTKNLKHEVRRIYILIFFLFKFLFILCM